MKKQGSAGIVVLIIAVVILALAVVGMGVYVFTSNMIVAEDVGNEKIEQNIVGENTKNNEKEEEKVNDVEQKVDARKYHVTNDLNQDKKWRCIRLTMYSYLNGYFGANNDSGMKTFMNIEENGDITVSASISNKQVLKKGFSSSLFDKKVDEIEIIEFGDTGTCAVVFFLLEDGNVEYIDLFELLLNEDISTKKKIEELSNIVRIESIVCAGKEAPADGHTGVAIDVYGKWHLLTEIGRNVASNPYKVNQLTSKYKVN